MLPFLKKSLAACIALCIVIGAASAQQQQKQTDALGARIGAPVALVAPVQPAAGEYGTRPATIPPPELGTQQPMASDHAAWDLWSTLPFVVDFKNGFSVRSRDGQFSFKFNNLTQFDYRDFSHTAQNIHTQTSLQDNFSLARQWLIFTGNATEYVDYAVIVAAGPASSVTGPSTVNVLDAYMDFNPFGKEDKELLQIRVGRFKTPYLYQFYKISPQDFNTPEASMFGTNFFQNRQLGVMAHGFLFDKRLDYAAGLFNGAPNTFDVAQSNREAIFFLGYQPFVNDKGSLLQNLILSGSYAAGDQFGASIPSSLSTAIPSAGPPNNPLISPTFLQFGPTTTQNGFHQFWAGEVVWVYRSFNLYAEYTGGDQTYGLTTAPSKSFPVSVSGYSVAGTYFFTGEEASPTRRRIKPLQPYNFQSGGLGAFEGFARYSNLVLGNSVFANGLANPALFANSVNATDIGVNWYLNEYIKIVFDWQHAWFNQGVSLTGAAGGNNTKEEDLFWLRFQLYY
jgi:phosphate-selective porin OprO/OprP